MNKPTTLKIFLVVLFLVNSIIAVSQTVKPFTPRYDSSLKGDMLLIGNNILNRDKDRSPDRGEPTDAYNGSKNNNDFNMKYIDIDNDNSTFSSSSANLAIPQSSKDCYTIVYAGLYWSGIYDEKSVNNGDVNRNNLGKVKFKLANQSNYEDIEGELVYDYNTGTSNGTQKPYVYYFDATKLIKDLTNAEGTYTLANVISGQGTIDGGFAAGWSLFVVYEDPKATAKYITSYDGFSFIKASSPPLEYNITGFKTIPTGRVKAKLAFAALEGDQNTKGDSYFVNNTKIYTDERPSNNFFNSSINTLSGSYEDREPKSSNTLGFDTGIIELNNGNNSIIDNNDTRATLKLSTDGDGYGIYFNAFNIEIIEPTIVLTKIVEDVDGNDIGGGDVTLNQPLEYVITFQNTGNDDATNFTIRDILPINVIFDENTGITLPRGVTKRSYNPTTREIIFDIDSDRVKINGSKHSIRLNVQVVPDCKSLSDACSNSIDNQAFATYKGKENDSFTITDDPSVDTNTGCILIPKATNFLVGIDNCVYEENITLCDSNVDLVAADGYEEYTWSTDEDGKNVVGKNQTLNVSKEGTYYVSNLAVAPCRSIKQKFVVTRFGSTRPNPVIPFADETLICTNNGKPLPNIYLCGANSFKEIKTGINDGSVIVWEKTDCVDEDLPESCANESDSCQWQEVARGPNYIANSSGQYRITINYPGGCYNQYYFNVYQNLLNPTATSNDIICTKNGNITIGGVPSGYEYRLGETGEWQPSNIFNDISVPDYYTVYIRQIGVTTNPCLFDVKNIQIRKRDFTVSTIVTNPACFGEKGSVNVAANDVEAQYYFTLRDNAGAIHTEIGPIANNDYEFKNLSPGKYTIQVKTDDGCDKTEAFEIIEPAKLTATAAITKSLTACSNGEITVYPVGGTPSASGSYYYFINGASTFQTSPIIEVVEPLPAGGVYNIRVVDENNCFVDLPPITIQSLPKPEYNVTVTDLKCYNDKATITFEVTNANGYTLQYSIDNGNTFSNNPVFLNLDSGVYQAVLKYSLTESNGVVTECLDDAQTIRITAPSTTLTASAGVARLAGCGTEQDGKPTGLIRITNAEGGSPAYTYSFDGGNTWQASNEKEVPSGSYNLAIKDAVGCIYQIPYEVKLDPKPADPEIDPNINPVYNCDGSANATVVVNNPGNSGGTTYTYEYYLQQNQTGAIVPNNPIDSNVFTNVPTGTHNVIVKYKVQTVSDYSILLQEDFDSGPPTTSPGIASAYCFNDQRVNSPYTCGTRSVEDNQYSVASFFWRSDDPNNNNTGAWYHFKDHTTNGTDPNGRFLLVNIGSAAGAYGILYSKPIVDVIPFQDIKIEVYLANLLRRGKDGASPDFIIELVDPSGNVVASQFTGVIAEGINSPDRNKWVFKELSLNPGDNTNLTFRIKSGSILYSGNDAVIDDIKVYQIPESCGDEKSIPVIIEGDRAFESTEPKIQNAQCNGGTDGSIEINAQNFDTTNGFFYSIDNGTTWNNSTTSPVTVSGLAAGDYKVIVQNNMSAEGCKYNFDLTITEPDVIIASAIVTPATCSTGGTVTVTANGGTPAFQYGLQKEGSIAEPVFQISKEFTDVESGKYLVFVKDANGCTPEEPIEIEIIAPIEPIATLDATTSLCYDGNNRVLLTVNVEAGTGKAPFSYSISSGQAAVNNTFSVLPGNYTITVTDANGCTDEITNISVAEKLTARVNSIGELFCDPITPATIAVSIEGGTQAYSYTVNGGDSVPLAIGVNSFTYNADIAGEYTIVITDAVGCTSTVKPIVAEIVIPTLTVIPTQVTCRGANNGKVQLLGKGGSGGFTYSNDGITYNNVRLIENLSAGVEYTFYVKDSKGCVGEAKVTLTEPIADLAATVTETQFSCNASNGKVGGSVVINTPTGGTAPYTYSFTVGTKITSGNTLTINDTTANVNYSWAVKDKNGCEVGGNGTLLKLNPPVIEGILSSTLTCKPDEDTATVTVTRTAGTGMGNLTYSITAPVAAITSNTNGIFSELSGGVTYTFRVTDANGCYDVKSFTVPVRQQITIEQQILTHVSCKGDATGSVKLTVIDNVGIVETQLLDSANNRINYSSSSGTIYTYTGLLAGTYTFRATDKGTECFKEETIIITEPDNELKATVATVNANCNMPTSQVTVTASGGTVDYKYSFVPRSDGRIGDLQDSNIANLNPAIKDWDVYIVDAKGCQIKRQFSIAADPVPAVTAAATGECLGDGTDYIITATVSGGVAPFRYSINDGKSYQSNNTFIVTSAGDYKIKVLDNNNCPAESGVVTVHPKLTLSAVRNKDNTCHPGNENANITLTASGGNPSAIKRYEYSDDNGGSWNLMTSNVLNTAAVGSFIFKVTDNSSNCSAQTTLPIVTTAKVDPEITTISLTQAINCSGDTATIKAEISGTGVAPFTFSIDGGAFQSSPIFSELTAGEHTVTVKDSKDCTDSEDITIAGKDPILFTLDKVDIQCTKDAGTTLGSITVMGVTGGTAPYRYFIKNNFNDPIPGNPYTTNVGPDFNEDYTFEELINFGLYTITVVDANGCSHSEDISMTSPPEDLVIDIDTSAPTCSEGTATVTVEAEPLGSNYTFGIFNSNLPPYSSNLVAPNNGAYSHIFRGLIPGVRYTFVVYDGDTGCYYVNTAKIPIPGASTLDPTIVPHNVTCIGEDDGSVSFEITGYAPSTTAIEYQVFTNQTNQAISAVLTHTIGDPLPVTYPALPAAGNLAPGSYYIVFTEIGGANDGCIRASEPFEIKESSVELSVTASPLENANCNNLGKISVQAKDGTPGYTYQVVPQGESTNDSDWVETSIFELEGDYDSNGGIQYDVYAKDANGCIKQVSGSITVIKDDEPIVIPPAAQICYNGNEFTITFSSTIDPDLDETKTTYSVNGSDFQTSPNFTFNAAGTYNLVVKDSNGCTDNVDYFVYPQLELKAEVTEELDCTTTPPDAIIELTATGGDPAANYTYEYARNAAGPWTDMVSNELTGAVVGDYFFRVTDANNTTVCQATTSLTIDPLPTPEIATIATGVTCYDGSDGTITVTVTGGVGGYTYQLTGSASANNTTGDVTGIYTGLAYGDDYQITVTDSKSCTYITDDDILVDQPDAVSATSTITAPLECAVGNAPTKAIVTINATGGNGKYLYSYDGGDTYIESNVYETSVGETFDVLIKDTNDCPFTLSKGVDVPALNPPTAFDFSQTDVTCIDRASDVAVTVTNGVYPLEIQIIDPIAAITTVTLADNTAPAMFNNLAPGEYTFLVTDNNGCTYQDIYTVIDVTEIQIAGAIQDEISCNAVNGTNNNGSATFVVTGFSATGNYDINVTSLPVGLPFTQLPLEDDVITLTGLSAGTYTVTVTDRTTGCENQDSVTFAEPVAINFDATGTNVNCNQDESAITVTNVTGGTGAYSYAAVRGLSAPTNYSDSNVIVVDTNLTDLIWNVYVRDEKGCIAIVPVTVVLDPLPTVTVEPFSHCPDNSGKYTVTLTGTGVGLGTSAYKYSIGSGYQTSNVFTVDNPATYNVSVIDANGCTNETAVEFTIFKPIQLDYRVDALPTCNTADAAVTLTASGGNPLENYQYKQELGGVYTNNNEFTNLAAGKHTFYAIDTNTNCETAVEVTLKAATEITGLTATGTNATCFEGTNGFVTVTMDEPADGVNDNPIYTFTLSGTSLTGVVVNRPSQQSRVFNNLEAGDYTITATSGRNCTATAQATVGQPDLIEVTDVTVSQFECNPGTNNANVATITVNTVIGGSGDYTIYEFSKVGTGIVQRTRSNSYTTGDFTGGSYTVTVYDSNNCSGTYEIAIDIDAYIALDKIDVTKTPITCENLETITATAVNVSGANVTSGIEYRLTDASGNILETNTSGVFSGLNIGSYIITATNTTTGCSIRKVHYVNNPNTFILQATKISDAICFDGTDGAVELTFVDQIPTPVDGAGAFSYTITSPSLAIPITGSALTAGPILVNGLKAGLYTVTAKLTNTPYCSAATTFSINQPSAALDLTVSATKITCVTGNNDGTISVTATGGWAGRYEYEVLKNGNPFSAYSTTTYYPNLEAGEYIVNVRDSKGCIDTETIPLEIPTPITVTAQPSTTLLSCNGDKTATLTAINVSGGQGSNYLYTINYLSVNPVVSSGPQSSPTFTGLGAGRYSITVTDGWSCGTESATVTIDEPTSIMPTLVQSRTATCLTQAQLTLSAVGGTPPYTYSSDNVSYSTTAFDPSVTIDVAPGEYQYYVKDANNCVATISNGIKVPVMEPLEVALDTQNATINCKGDATGVIVAKATGGLGNYNYTLLDASGNAVTPAPVQLIPGRFEALEVGKYSVRVDSGDCNRISASADVTEPDEELTVSNISITPVTCNGENDGKIEITATGGTGQIKFAISPRMDKFFDSGTFDDLKPGKYQGIVQDELGCFVLFDFEITQPDILYGMVIETSVQPEVCDGDKDAAFSITVGGGVEPYSVAIDDVAGTYEQGIAGQVQFDFANLSGGTHTVYIKDSLGCTSELEVVLPDAVVLNPIALVTYDCVNNTASNIVTITIDSSNNPSDVDYDLDGLGNFQASNVFVNVAPGPHFVIARHSNGCEKLTANFDVDLIEPLALVLSNGEMNEIIATATGGGGGYEYSVNGESFSTNNKLVIYKSGNYTIVVRDKYGCEVAVNQYFEYIDICIPNYFTPNGDGNQDTWAPGCTNIYPDLTFNIFDRYGRVIAKYRLGQSWDGKYNGNELPTGDYWYVLKLNNNKDDREFVGHFTLYR